MKQTKIEELKLRFSIREIEGLGKCVVVPEDRWDTAWGVALLQEGCHIYNRTLPGGGNIVMKCLPLPKEDEPVRCEPAPLHQRWKRWTTEENVRLVKRVALLTLQGCASVYHALEKEFGRNAHTLKLQYGKIKNLPEYQVAAEQIQALGKPGSLPSLSQPPESPSTKLLPEPSEPTMPSTPLQRTMFIFECYCYTCKGPSRVETDAGVWQFCPICGAQLQIWNLHLVKTV